MQGFTSFDFILKEVLIKFPFSREFALVLQCVLMVVRFIFIFSLCKLQFFGRETLKIQSQISIKVFYSEILFPLIDHTPDEIDTAFLE